MTTENNVFHRCIKCGNSSKIEDLKESNDMILKCPCGGSIFEKEGKRYMIDVKHFDICTYFVSDGEVIHIV